MSIAAYIPIFLDQQRRRREEEERRAEETQKQYEELMRRPIKLSNTVTMESRVSTIRFD